LKVLLLTSPGPASGKAYGYFVGHYGEQRFPLGLGYLVSILRQHNINPDFYDLRAKNSSIDFSSYNFIGIHADSICFRDGTLPLISNIKNSGFKGKIALGGPHTTALPNTIPPTVDYIVQGEGEEIIYDLVFGNISKRLIKTDRIQDLDKLPMPAYDIYDKSLYQMGFGEFKGASRVYTYSSSRGCPFNCSFCSAKNFFERKWTAHSPRRVIDDIKYLKKTYQIDGIYFREDNFCANPQRTREICKLLIEENVNIFWKCETRANTSYEDLKLMYDAGLRNVYTGFESGSERMLKLFNKQLKIERAKQYMQDCKKIGILVYASFIFGAPYETQEDINLTNKFIEEIQADNVCRCTFTALPNSDEYKNNEKLIREKNITIVGDDLPKYEVK